MNEIIRTLSLHTRNLRLAPLRKAHPQQVKWLNDTKLMRFSENRHYQHTLKTQEEYLANFDFETNFIWSIDHYENAIIIGSITAHTDPHNGIADLGILIGDERFQGEGYGKEAWEAVIKFMFGLGIRKIEAGCMKVNAPMIGIFKATGMDYEGLSKSHFLWEGTKVDLVRYGRFA